MITFDTTCIEESIVYEIRIHKMKKSFIKFNLTYVELFELFPDNETKYEQNCM